MEPTFRELFSLPENEVFKIVSFPDRIYHSHSFNATRSPRYRYTVRAVQAKADITLIKAEVFLDAHFYCNLLRLEYRGGRLIEQARHRRGRRLGRQILASLRILSADTTPPVVGVVKLTFDPVLQAYQVEIWETLEPPPTATHDIKVLHQMGRQGPITARGDPGRAARPQGAAGRGSGLRRGRAQLPLNGRIDDPVWDTNFNRALQVPSSPEPNAPQNAVETRSYLLVFQKAWVVAAGDVAPVRYRNAMMDDDNPDRHADNIIDIRWLLQRKLGGRSVYCQEVTLPPGTVEEAHVYLGAEALYYVVAGEGVAYLGEQDDPSLANRPTVSRDVLGAGFQCCKAVPIKPGHTVYAKNGAIQGIANPGDRPLHLVRFGTHMA